MRRYELGVIGGGIVGLMTAYHFLKMGGESVVVFEKGYLGCGSTGRCGAGIREQWSTPENIELAKRSIDMWEKLEDELGADIDFKQGGYLILAFSDDEAEELKENVKIQNKYGVRSRVISPDEAKELVPFLNTEKVVLATYNPRDAKADPFKVLLALKNKVEELGGEVLTWTEVNGVEIRDNVVKRIKTARGEFEVNAVLNAAGPWARDVGKMLQADIPVIPYRHEIMVTERISELFDPMVISFSKGIYFQQLKEGEIIGGIGNPEEAPGINLKCSKWFPYHFAKTLIEIAPVLRHLRMLRHWAGHYCVSPDARPILGKIGKIENAYHAVGFSGHGFMVAPMVGKLMAELVLGKTPSLDISPFSYSRFEKGVEVKERSVVGRRSLKIPMQFLLTFFDLLPTLFCFPCWASPQAHLPLAKETLL